MPHVPHEGGPFDRPIWNDDPDDNETDAAVDLDPETGKLPESYSVTMYDGDDYEDHRAGEPVNGRFVQHVYDLAERGGKKYYKYRGVSN